MENLSSGMEGLLSIHSPNMTDMPALAELPDVLQKREIGKRSKIDKGHYKQIKRSLKILAADRFKVREQEIRDETEKSIKKIVNDLDKAVNIEYENSGFIAGEAKEELEDKTKAELDKVRKSFQKNLMDASIRLSMRDFEDRVFLYDRISRELAKQEDEFSAQGRDKDIAAANEKLSKNDANRQKLLDGADKELKALQKAVQKLEGSRQGTRPSSFYATFDLYEQAHADVKSDPAITKKGKKKAQEARKSSTADQRVQSMQFDATHTETMTTALQTINSQTATSQERQEAVKQLITETVLRDATLEAQRKAVHNLPVTEHAAARERAAQQVRNSPNIARRKNEAINRSSVQEAIAVAREEPSPADHAKRREALEKAMEKTIRHSVADETQTAVMQEAAEERFVTYIKAGIDARNKIAGKAIHDNDDLRTLRHMLSDHDEVHLALGYLGRLPDAGTALTKFRQAKFPHSHMNDAIKSITTEEAQNAMAYYKKMQSIASKAVPDFIKGYVNDNGVTSVKAYENALATSRSVKEYLDKLTARRLKDADKEKLTKDAIATMIASPLYTDAVDTRLDAMKAHADMPKLLPDGTLPHGVDEAAFIREVAGKAASLNVELRVLASAERDAQQTFRHDPIIRKDVEDTRNAPETKSIMTELCADDKTTQAVTDLMASSEETTRAQIAKDFVKERFFDAYAKLAVADSIGTDEITEREEAERHDWARHNSILQQNSASVSSTLGKLEKIIQSDGDTASKTSEVKRVMDQLVHETTRAATGSRVRNNALAAPFAHKRLARLTASWDAMARSARQTQMAREAAEKASASVAVTYEGSLQDHLDRIMRTTVEDSLKHESKTAIEQHPNYLEDRKAQQLQSAAYTLLRDDIKSDYKRKIDDAEKRYEKDIKDAKSAYSAKLEEAKAQRNKAMGKINEYSGLVHGKDKAKQVDDKYQEDCTAAKEARNKALEEAENYKNQVYSEQKAALVVAKRIYSHVKISTIQTEIDTIKENLLDVTGKLDKSFKEKKEIIEKKAKDEEMSRVKRAKWDVHAVYLQGKQIAQKETEGEALAVLNTAKADTADAKGELEKARAQLVLQESYRKDVLDQLHTLSLKKSMNGEDKAKLETQIAEASKVLESFGPILKDANKQVFDCTTKLSAAERAETMANGKYNEEKQKLEALENEIVLALKRHESHKDKRTRYRERLAKLDEDHIKFMRSRELTLRIVLITAVAAASGSTTSGLQQFSGGYFNSALAALRGS